MTGYDKYGEAGGATKEFYSMLSDAVQATVFFTTPGNHDFWKYGRALEAFREAVEASTRDLGAEHPLTQGMLRAMDDAQAAADKQAQQRARLQARKAAHATPRGGRSPRSPRAGGAARKHAAMASATAAYGGKGRKK